MSSRLMWWKLYLIFIVRNPRCLFDSIMKTIHCLFSVLLLLPLSVSFASPVVECKRIVLDGGLESFADHVITYQEGPAPEWKKIWDQAREFYGQKKYEQARAYYEQLLAQKDNVDQARWEYVTLLMCLKQWQKAGIELGVLISHDPRRPEYQLARAEIALGSGELHEAEKIYAPLYEQQCVVLGCTEGKSRILSGYITVLEELGEMDVLGPLLEELINLRPDDGAVQEKAAEIALKNKHPQRALFFLNKLAENEPDDSTIFQQIALIYESLGNTKEAAAYWQEVVGLDTHSRPANRKLIDYYHKLNNKPMELKHVEALLELTPADSELLKRASQLHEQMDRPDRALDYYNRLLNLQPENNEITLHKEHAVQQLAVKLLSLVENSGSGMLWQDLVQVTDDRMAVYRAMASLLRCEHGKGNELIEVLLVINHESPADIVIHDELTTLIKEQGRDDILASVHDVDSAPPVSLPQ